jgi:hypothetical protein
VNEMLTHPLALPIFFLVFAAAGSIVLWLALRRHDKRIEIEREILRSNGYDPD